MGTYLNPGNARFQRMRNDKIFIDKSGMIDLINDIVNTPSGYLCMTRPRRFGKTYAANMLAAYFDKSVDSHALFDDLEIAKLPSYEKNLNQYNVIQVDVQGFRTRFGQDDFEAKFENVLIREMREQWPIIDENEHALVGAIDCVYQHYGEQFVFILDEWDCICRNDINDEKHKKWISFLRGLFKDDAISAATGLAYLTGILPIRKYGTQSAMGHFEECSIVQPLRFTPWIGFTTAEVDVLSNKYELERAEVKHWYDGYLLENTHVYNPASVAKACINQKCDMYWTKTESFESIKRYIGMNFDGLKDKIIQMLEGEPLPIWVQAFNNTMNELNDVNDVLTLLIHLGYLGYNNVTKTAFIPNEEVRQLLECAVRSLGWQEVMKAIDQSESFMNAVKSRNADKAGDILRRMHSEVTSILKYNDENSLSCALGFAIYAGRKDYTVIREMPTGEGFADIVMIPRSDRDVPAMIVELKWDKDAETAIYQAKQRHYPQGLEYYQGNMILVGVNYDKDAKDKVHECIIEDWQKE